VSRRSPAIIQNREFWHVTRRSLLRSFDCTSAHIAEIPSRYKTSRPSPTVFSGYTFGPESSGLYIGGAFRSRVEPAGLPWGVARPEHVLVRPDSVHWGPPGSLLHSNTGDPIQPVTLRPRTGVALPRGVLCPSYTAPPPILTPAIFCFYHHHSRRWGRDADPQPNPGQRRPAVPPFPHSLFVTHSACCCSVRTDCAPQYSLPVLFLWRVFVPMRTVAAPAERQATAPSR